MADHQTQFSTNAGITQSSATGTYETKHWSTSFLLPTSERSPESSRTQRKRALIVLNQPFSFSLFDRLWNSTQHHFCADGGANRVHDLLRGARSSKENKQDCGEAVDERLKYLPDLIKGDLDSLRDDVKDYYTSKGVPIITEEDQYSTDLMKCISSLEEIEKRSLAPDVDLYEVVLLGGLSGRLDQTIHTLSYLHKLRKTGRRVFAVTDENVGWVLDEGEHFIAIEHSVLGPTCGLLPVGIDSTVLSTTGLRWNLSENVSSFDGMVSTSNHLVPEESTVWVKTSKPIWWCAELKQIS